jgi:hypothetical protein
MPLGGAQWRDVQTLPETLAWLFWDAEVSTIDVHRDANAILARLLERGRFVDVRWAVATYGLAGIHAFLRDVGHPELTPRTLAFWRAALNAKEERWRDPRASRPLNAAPWID